MIETVLLSGVSGMTTEILLSSLRKLGRKYSVDIKYVLSEKVEADFQKCLDIAIKAFLEFVSKNADLKKIQEKMIFEYLKSSVVTEEIWHLLDPGSEIFDRGLLTQNACKTLLEVLLCEYHTAPILCVAITVVAILLILITVSTVILKYEIPPCW
jgi:hypothetical protein